MNISSQDMDYRGTIRAAALTFMERHQGEHLGDLSQFFKRTINHLVDRFQVDKLLAIQLTSEAHGDLIDINMRQRADLKASSEYQVTITDTVRGCSWSVPVHLLYEHLISAGHGKLITPAT